MGVPLTVNASTQFFFRQPQSPRRISKPIATGTAYPVGRNLVRGFKVHAELVDPWPLRSSPRASSIETAQYSGAISGRAPPRSLTPAIFARPATITSTGWVHLDNTANGSDARRQSLEGYKWWNFAYPTLLTTERMRWRDFVALH